MTDRKKLMDIICESVRTDRCVGNCNHPHCNTVQIICDHLLSEGVTILPCKMGDEVWGIKSYNHGGKRVKKGIVHQMFYGEDMKLCIAVKGVCRGVWNEKVFATEEDARRALEVFSENSQ